MKIGSSTLSTSTQLSGGTPFTPGRVQGHPLAVLLFGKRRAKLVDRRKYPGLKKSLRKLEEVKDQIAELLGVPGSAFSIELCEGSNASISRDGQIAFGVGLLEQHQGDDDLLVAVLGHEIGHQPWTWPSGDLSRLNKGQLDQLYREEEAKADRFAGKVLAELGAHPESICNFLVRSQGFEGKKPSDYYPAEVRAEMIKSAFRRRDRALNEGATSARSQARRRQLR